MKSAFILLFVYVLHKTLSAVVPTEKGIWRNLQKKKNYFLHSRESWALPAPSDSMVQITLVRTCQSNWTAAAGRELEAPFELAHVVMTHHPII